MRIIDADALITEVKSLRTTITGEHTLIEHMDAYRDTVIRTIDEQPTTEAANPRDVAREPVRGKLFDNVPHKPLPSYIKPETLVCFRCPECGGQVAQRTTIFPSGWYFDNFCRKCGAKIDHANVEKELIAEKNGGKEK